jgi:hypothetical protein
MIAYYSTTGFVTLSVGNTGGGWGLSRAKHATRAVHQSTNREQAKVGRIGVEPRDIGWIGV